jgi:nitrite reductase (NO-forming)
MTSDPNRGGRPAPSTTTAQPVRPVPVDLGGASAFRPGPRRADDRRVAVASVVLAAAFLALAGLTAVARPLLGPGVSAWLPLHLALAGGATTAIAGVMPFFVAALAAGHPADVRVRTAAVGLVAAGALLVGARGVLPSLGWLPALGGLLYLAGIGMTALSVRGSGRAGLMVRRPVVTLGYTLALVNVAIGATLGTLAVAGWTPVVERWAALRPAHAWTNLVGFLSVVIVATLLHFLPTVLGTRIVPRRSAILAVLALAMGSPIVVAGLAAGWGTVAGGGAALTLVGAGALALEAARDARARGRWTTDPGWHLVAEVGLLAGVAWFVVGIALASWRVVAFALGLAPDAWSTPLVGASLAVGWVVGVLIASWTHLLPSIGPGGPPEHAAQRRILGRAAGVRVVAFNLGVLLLAVGWPAGIPAVAAMGLGLVVAVVIASAALALAALRVR